MDNIQKLILGVLGISGMIAMLVPSSASLAPPAAEAVAPPAAAEIIEPAATEEEAIPEEEIAEESEMTDEDVFMMGEPAIDGNPLQGGQSNNDAPPAAAAQFVPAPSFDYIQPGIVTGQSFATPSAPAPPPAQ